MWRISSAASSIVGVILLPQIHKRRVLYKPIPKGRRRCRAAAVVRGGLHKNPVRRQAPTQAARWIEGHGSELFYGPLMKHEDARDIAVRCDGEVRDVGVAGAAEELDRADQRDV